MAHRLYFGQSSLLNDRYLNPSIHSQSQRIICIWDQICWSKSFMIRKLNTFLKTTKFWVPAVAVAYIEWNT